MQVNSPPQNLAFYPYAVEKLLLKMQQMNPDPSLLKRSLDTPDWTLEQLWQVAVLNHIRGDYANALRYYLRLLQWTEHQSEQHAEVLEATGHIFLLNRHFKDALRMFDKAAQLSQHLLRLPFYQAEVYHQQRQLPLAAAALSRFLEQYPAQDQLAARAYRLLAALQDQLADTSAVRATFQAAAQRFDSWAFELLAQTYQPLLPQQQVSAAPRSHAQLEHQVFVGEEFNEWYPYRAPLAQRAACLQQALPRLQEGLNRLLAPLTLEPARQRRIVMVGFFDRPQGMPYLDLVIETARKYSVTVIHIGPQPAAFAQEDWMRLYPVSNSLQQIYEAIVSHTPDLLIYLDVGPSSPHLYALASRRLAPVQAVLGAYPGSSQLDTLDHMLSYDWLEPEQASDHYSEQLYQLSGTPLRAAPLPDQFIARDHFNLPEGQHTYLCPLPAPSLPEAFLPLLGEILRQDPQGLILLLTYNPQVDQLLFQRLQALFPEQANRVSLLRGLDEHSLLSLVREVDVLLDPIEDGLNYSLWRLIPLGTPIVSCWGETACGRYASGLYSLLGFTESLADGPDAYAQTAVRLANDPELKTRLRSHLQKHAQALFQFDACLASFHAFIEQHLPAAPNA